MEEYQTRDEVEYGCAGIVKNSGLGMEARCGSTPVFTIQLSCESWICPTHKVGVCERCAPTMVFFGYQLTRIEES